MPKKREAVKLTSPNIITTKQALAAAGTATALAMALGLSVSTVTRWGKHPPIKHQSKIVELYGVKP